MIRATKFRKSIEADKNEGGIGIASMASNRSYLERGRAEEKIEGMINDGFDAHQGNQSFRICASVPSFVSASRPRAPIRATNTSSCDAFELTEQPRNRFLQV